MWYRLLRFLRAAAIYAVLTIFAVIMLFPFLVMVFTSLKTPADTFSYPPRLLPREQVTITLPGYERPLPLHWVRRENSELLPMALVEDNVRVGIFAPLRADGTPDPSRQVMRRFGEVKVAGGETPKTVMLNGVEAPVYLVSVNGEVQEMVVLTRTAVGRFVNPDNPQDVAVANVRLSPPVTRLTARPENYLAVVSLLGFDRALTNTALITLLTVIGQLTTSVLGGYAFARLRFPGRDQLFLVYLGTVMVPFVVLIIPLYQLMVAIGWINSMPALILPWLYTAYGTFLMRQFFITIPREIEEAALIDGASRLTILTRIFLPASVPALATLATFAFLHAWNSFFWPLVVVNTGNTRAQVLTLALNVLRGRAADSPNLILAGAAISIVPPTLIFALAQRYYVESVASSGLKG
ncbi:MAG: carbohydrate ABC transporter permease [Thermoflexales bacterium]|nr:carbohydrate ABC transporter permease [Thermoflexales bacterium]MCX7938254.1 carbohydrate ABC transporter permease [Thermoflexales bacterium]MDW8292055.1 carbohydrate ABC transporter permease [Anaerolineae bacterium]